GKSHPAPNDSVLSARAACRFNKLCQPRQRLRIQLIVLAPTLPDQANIAGMRNAAVFGNNSS
ncbi:MAG TPA: hypothetical protein VLJ17_15010, partial [Xanthobacteraceae bacterium]|nr:hypothetical protein [Xanthobacteraceae bacterium]